MLPLHSGLALLLLQAATLSRSRVPASEEQEVELSLDRTGMVRITAESVKGTSCELVDQLRGPFASSGEPGQSNCALDELLDEGSYKLRLHSEPPETNAVGVQVQPFAELNPTALRLDPRGSAQQEVHPGQQASYWLKVGQREPVTLRISGRTAGRVALWRAGEWLEDANLREQPVSPSPGQPIHEWWLEAVLEPGEYRLTIYGTAANEWSRGTPSDLVSIAYGFPRAPLDRIAHLVVPHWGVVGLELPSEVRAAFMSVARGTAAPTRLTLHPIDEGGSTHVFASDGACSIELKALVPECIAVGSSNLKRRVLLVRGVPGTAVDLQWSRYSDALWWADGDYGPPASELIFTPPSSGRYLVAVQDMPLDSDALPVSCSLQRFDKGTWAELASDLLTVSPTRPFERRANYDGIEASIWFRVLAESKYEIFTEGQTKSGCELFRSREGEVARITETESQAQSCRVSRVLPAGSYQLKLYGGIEGIERVRIAAEGAPKAITAGKNGCSFMAFLDAKARFRVLLSREGSSAVRGFTLRPLPLSLAEPLSLVLEPSSWAYLPVAETGSVVTSSLGANDGFRCGWGNAATLDATEGRCELSRGGSLVALFSRSDEPLRLSVRRPSPPPPAASALVSFAPTPSSLPSLEAGRPRFVDFAREAAHSMLFQVKEAGLYHVATQGLLATECVLRTPAVAVLAKDRGGGRGRNCLVATYLRPGRYLATARTVGQSRGRAAMVLNRGPAREVESVAPDGGVFFSAGAGELIQQRLSIEAPGPYGLRTSGQGISIQCRLDDAQGWPVEAVPSSCSGVHQLRPGQYLWTQFPLSVDSARHTVLRAAAVPTLLRGDEPHRVELNTWYAAELSGRGEDGFDFVLPAELDADFTLTEAMQARLYLLAADGALQSVDAIRTGQTLHLPAGDYRLVAQHSRGDVAIHYRLYIGSNTLAPGLSRDVQVPSRLNLRVPETGTVQIRSDGELGVRCRVLDGEGRLRFEEREHPEDWNCTASGLLQAGDYQLALEPTHLVPGRTRISVIAPKLQQGPELANGMVFPLQRSVLVSRVPAIASNALHEIALRGSQPFSYALESDNGRIVEQQDEVREARILLHSEADRFQLRLWTLSPQANVSIGYLQRAIAGSFSGEIPAQGAARVLVQHSGQYQTSKDVFCLPASKHGILRPCGPIISLERGDVIFAPLRESGPTRLTMAEQVVRLPQNEPQQLRLSREPIIQRQESANPQLHLLSVLLSQPGQSSPGCELSGGVRAQLAAGCFAATALTVESTAFVWSPAEETEAELTRTSVPLPEPRSLGAGTQSVQWSGETGRFSLPAQEGRIELTLTPNTWVIQLNADSKAADLCAPVATLSRCVLGVQGGELIVHSPSASIGHAELTLIIGEVARPVIALERVHEEIASSFGVLRLAIAAAPTQRLLSVLGAQRCVLSFSDGRRVDGCELTIPADTAAQASVSHGADALRAVLHGLDDAAQATFGLPLPAEPPRELSVAQALTLSGALVDRSFVVPLEASVRIRSDAGVCAVYADDRALAVHGWQRGCDIHRALLPGRYRLLVRPFAGAPLRGSLVWSYEPVEALGDGLSSEHWIAADQVRLFRFQTPSSRRVGLGIQVPADRLSCEVFDQHYRSLGEGCQQFLNLQAGSFYLAVRSSPANPPVPFKAMLVGLKASNLGVPEDYLREFFQRIGAAQ